jgi:DNA-binding response OmpR family regulator
MNLLLAKEALQTLTPRILSCDDNEMSRGLLRRMLTRRGYLVEEAIDGETAIEAIAKRPPDLVLLDLRLPDINGSEVLRHLRCDFGIDELPIIMISAEHDGEAAAACLALGACDYVTKPIDASALYTRVSIYLDRRFARVLKPTDTAAATLRIVH